MTCAIFKTLLYTWKNKNRVVSLFGLSRPVYPVSHVKPCTTACADAIQAKTRPRQSRSYAIYSQANIFGVNEIVALLFTILKRRCIRARYT